MPNHTKGRGLVSVLKERCSRMARPLAGAGYEQGTLILFLMLSMVVSLMVSGMPGAQSSNSVSNSVNASTTTSTTSLNTTTTTTINAITTTTINAITTTTTVPSTTTISNSVNTTSTVNTTTTTATTTVSTTAPTTSTASTTTIQQFYQNTTFISSGLPANALWQINVNGQTSTARSQNSITVPIPEGNFVIAIYNVTVGANVYQAVPIHKIAIGGDQMVGFTVNPPSVFSLHKSGSAYSASFSPGSKHLLLNVYNVFFNRLRVNLNGTPSSFNISVTNATAPPPGVDAAPSQVYQYFQINATATGPADNTVVNADEYISNVTYNFTVPNSWIASQKTVATNITLYKYVNGSWTGLPTTRYASNGTYSFFRALSSSFSTYAVGYTVSGKTVTTANVLLTMPAGYPTYFWSTGGEALGGVFTLQTSVNFTLVSDSSEGSTTGKSSNRNVNATDTGYSSASTGNFTFSTSATSFDVGMIGLGANVLMPNGNIAVANTGTSGGSSLIIPFEVYQSNSFVVVMMGAGGGSFTAPTPPGGCFSRDYIKGGTSTSTEEAVTCNSLAAGVYQISMSTGTALSSISAAAFVFPPYNVTFNSIPSSGNILTGNAVLGIHDQVSGNVVYAIGTGTINATYPVGPGNWMFSTWVANSPTNATDPGNFIISNTFAANTFLTIMGNGIITADWNSVSLSDVASSDPIAPGANQVLTATFDNGITPITYNFLVYNSIGKLVANALYTKVGSTSNTFTFGIQSAWGTGTFMANVIATDLGSPWPYNIVLTNSIKFDVQAVTNVCGIKLSNSLIDFGTIQPGSSVATANLVTDTNLAGTVNANIFVEGSNWIVPGSSPNFFAANTLWDDKSDATYTGTAVNFGGTPAPSNFLDTKITVNTVSANFIYFGLGVPGGQSAASYTQNIIIENSC